jgi:energy-coupling factor transporter ATP-binding protein EcfA2
MVKDLIISLKNEGTTILFSTHRMDNIEELCDQTHAEFELRKEFLQFTDLLVDGRYEAPNIDRQRPWVGSTNQRFHFLTERYTPEIIFKQTTDRIEITLSPKGTATVNGWATSDAVEKLLENL